MGLLQSIFGALSRSLDVIDGPPRGVRWRRVRPRPQPPVRAWRAEADCSVETGQGTLRARGGVDYIVDYGGSDRAIVRGDIFERTYARTGDSCYTKRLDVVLRCFTLDRPVMVKTLEGLQRAAAGDWIVEGVAGELWPVPRTKEPAKYEPA